MTGVFFKRPDFELDLHKSNNH